MSIQPGEFFAVAFDKPIIQEAEFAVAPDHYTLDDVVYARDNKIVFAPIPEPTTWLMLAVRAAIARAAQSHRVPASASGLGKRPLLPGACRPARTRDARVASDPLSSE